MLRFSEVFGMILATAAITGCASSGDNRDDAAADLGPMPTVEGPYRDSVITVRAFEDAAFSGIRGLGATSTDHAAQFMSEAGFRVNASIDGDLDKVMEEGDRQQGGQGRQDQAIRQGQQHQARFVFVGRVTRFEVLQVQGKSGFRFAGIGGSKKSRDKRIRVTISGKIVDIETGMHVASARASHERVIESSGFSVSVGDTELGNEEEVTIDQSNAGEVIQICLNKLSIKLVRGLNQRNSRPLATAKN